LRSKQHPEHQKKDLVSLNNRVLREHELDRPEVSNARLRLIGSFEGGPAGEEHSVTYDLDGTGLLETGAAKGETVVGGIAGDVHALVEDYIQAFVPDINREGAKYDEPCLPNARAPDGVVAKPDPAITSRYQT